MALSLSGLAPQLKWLLGTCSCTGCDSSGAQADGQISLTAESSGGFTTRQPLGRGDSLDITFTPRHFGTDDGFGGSQPITPRQRDIRDQLELPRLSSYPV